MEWGVFCHPQHTNKNHVRSCSQNYFTALDNSTSRPPACLASRSRHRKNFGRNSSIQMSRHIGDVCLATWCILSEPGTYGDISPFLRRGSLWITKIVIYMPHNVVLPVIYSLARCYDHFVERVPARPPPIACRRSATFSFGEHSFAVSTCV